MNSRLREKLSKVEWLVSRDVLLRMQSSGYQPFRHSSGFCLSQRVRITDTGSHLRAFERQELVGPAAWQATGHCEAQAIGASHVDLHRLTLLLRHLSGTLTMDAASRRCVARLKQRPCSLFPLPTSLCRICSYVGPDT